MALLLDACALIAYLRDEAGADQVEAILIQQPEQISIHAINLAEVYYGALVRDGETRAREMLTEVAQLGIAIREDVPDAVWRSAAECKWNIYRESKQPGSKQQPGAFADCFCAAYARSYGLEVVTTDHGEFDFLTREKFCQTRFIR